MPKKYVVITGELPASAINDEMFADADLIDLGSPDLIVSDPTDYADARGMVDVALDDWITNTVARDPANNNMGMVDHNCHTWPGTTVEWGLVHTDYRGRARRWHTIAMVDESELTAYLTASNRAN